MGKLKLNTKKRLNVHREKKRIEREKERHREVRVRPDPKVEEMMRGVREPGTGDRQENPNAGTKRKCFLCGECRNPGGVCSNQGQRSAGA